MKFTVELPDELLKQFDMAVQLAGETKEKAVEDLMKSYIVQTFTQATSAYRNNETEQTDPYFAKAVHKIPKWASKPSLIPSKIIRAYLSLLEAKGTVTYFELMLRCSNKDLYPDEYVATFANNFAQMKFDDAKSHGKVFEITNGQRVILWENVKEAIMQNQNRFRNYSTATGYINKNSQKNMGKTDQRGTDHGQWLYLMRCEHCLHEYYANGSDIHLKKCPACQGGADTGAQ